MIHSIQTQAFKHTYTKGDNNYSKQLLLIFPWRVITQENFVNSETTLPEWAVTQRAQIKEPVSGACLNLPRKLFPKH